MSSRSKSHVFSFLGDCSAPGIWILSTEESHHALKVLRLKVGDAVQVSDGKGQIAAGTIDRVEGQTVVIAAKELRLVEKATPAITLMLAATKPNVLDDTLPGLVELGVDHLVVFLQSGQAKHRLNDKAVLRMERIISGAVKQTKTAWRPKLSVAATFEEACALVSPGGLRFVVDAQSDADFDATLRTVAGNESVTCLIGSEEGLVVDPEDLTKTGFKLVQMGSNILRATTAAIAAATIISNWRRSLSRTEKN